VKHQTANFVLEKETSNSTFGD